MNDSLIQRLRIYLEPPASRVTLAAVSIAFLDAHDIQSGIVTATGECSDTPGFCLDHFRQN